MILAESKGIINCSSRVLIKIPSGAVRKRDISVFLVISSFLGDCYGYGYFMLRFDRYLPLLSNVEVKDVLVRAFDRDEDHRPGDAVQQHDDEQEDVREPSLAPGANLRTEFVVER